MSNEWKRTIDDWQGRERQKLEAEARSRWAAAEATEQRAYQAKLSVHRRRFRCHVHRCDNTSRGPAYVTGVGREWEKPINLWQCSRCGHWTCEEHLYKGICIEDAQKLGAERAIRT